MIPETIIWYFCVKPEHKKGKYGFTFCSDNDENIGLDIFDNALQIYPRPGQVDKMLMVLKVLISPHIERILSEDVEIENPTLPKNVKAFLKACDIEAKVFFDIASIKKKFPQTTGTIEIISVGEGGAEVKTEITKIDEDSVWYGIG